MIGSTVSHYRILERLGAGGMGEVYLADDTKLQRSVALKFLPANLTDDPEARKRLEQEARAAAGLQHPGICTVHEIGEADGQIYIAMTYCVGRTLGERLQEGPLALDEALDLGTQIAEALAHAHEAGIVHRDLKPANIMLAPDGRPVLMDFGLARMTDRTRLTVAGSTLGTPRYMSPEQAQGAEVDQRTDIWSLGVVLYEAIAERLPFAGDHAQAVIYAILNEDPAPLTEARREVPFALERIVERCLAKDPARRYPNAAELAADLKELRDELATGARTERFKQLRRLRRRRRLLYGTVAALAVVGLTVLWQMERRRAATIDAIAVLPFANLSGETDQEYFADGMTDALITELQQLASDKLRVIGRTSVMSFKHTNKTLPEIARELNVDAVIEASVIRVDELVRVAAKLIRARPEERQLWAFTYERDMRDILSLHAEVAREVASQVQLALSPETETRLATERTVDPEAYEAYLKGRHFLLNVDLSGVRTRDPDALEEFQLIEKFFARSIGIDSTYAPAWAGLAEYHIQREHEGLGTDAIPQAFAAASRALELDDEVSAAHAAMAHILWEHQYKPREADAEMRRALELNPNNPWAHVIKAYFYSTMGRYEESAQAALKAVELDPLSLFINQVVWQPLAYAGRHEEAIRQIEKAREVFPDFPFWRNPMVATYRIAGEPEKGLALIEDADPEQITIRERFQVIPLLLDLDRQTEAKAYLERYRPQAEADSLFEPLCGAYAGVGDLSEARKWFEIAEERRLRSQVSTGTASSRSRSAGVMGLALLAVIMGDLDKAFEYFETAYDDRNWNLTRLALFAEREPDYKALAADPRYYEMVRRLGLRE